jgi:hypothetical protein
MKNKKLLVLSLAILTILGATQKMHAMEQKHPEGEADITFFQETYTTLFVAIQSYDYARISALTGNDALGQLLSTNPALALHYLKFAIKSLDTLTNTIIDLTPEEEDQKTYWNRLRFNSLRIANLLIKHGAKSEDLDLASQEKLRIYNERFHVRLDHRVRVNSKIELRHVPGFFAD